MRQTNLVRCLLYLSGYHCHRYLLLEEVHTREDYKAVFLTERNASLDIALS